MKLLSKQDYYNSLAKKPMGSEVIFFNENEEILIVKPNYKEGWVMPGGTVEAGESPKDCAVREVKEELGLDIENLQLLCIDYGQTTEGDYLKFVFFGGILSSEQIGEIVLQEKELTEMAFVAPNKLDGLFSTRKNKRLPFCLEALEKNIVIYLEHEERI
jgi:ADP-ribose pyrophosphatase YjhB (NUDIX family)